MKINLDKIDRETFFIRESREICDEPMFLINPKRIGLGNWNKDNLWFRSMICNSSGEIVSLGFKKFGNCGEKPDVFVLPDTFHGYTFTSKEDGSLLIVSKYKGKFIFRTRGTFDARKLENGNEIEDFEKNILPSLSIHDNSDTWNYSYLFEWLSPTNVIVVSQKEVKFILIGKINHELLSLESQSNLDKFAIDNNLGRPATFTFDKFSSHDLNNTIKGWSGLEGIVAYSSDGQTLFKFKSDWYCQLHKSKSDLSNFNKVMEKWFELDFPDKQTFYNWVEKEYDFELAESTSVLIDEVLQLRTNTRLVQDQIELVVNSLRHLSKRDFALTIMPQYGKTGFSSFYFDLYDNKPLTKESLKKLMEKIKEKTS